MQVTSPLDKTNTRRYIWLAKLCFSAVLIAYCLSLVDIRGFAGQIASADTTLVLVAMAINFLGTIVAKSAMVWWLASSPSQHVSLWRVISIHLSLRFYTLFLPRAVVVAIRWSKYRSLTRNTEALALLSLDMLVSLLFLSTGTLVFSWLGSMESDSHEIRWIALACTLGLGAVLFGAFAAPSLLKSTSTEDESLTLAGRLFFKWRQAVEALQLLKWKNSLVILAAAASNYALFLLSAYVLSISMDLGLSFIVIAWVRSAILLLAHIPITVAGLGVREVGFISFFGLYQVSPESALAYAMLSFGVQVGLGAIGGILEAYQWLSAREHSHEG